MTNILFQIYRSDNEDFASSFDMGDLELILTGHEVSSRGNSRFLNMIYVSLVDLIGGLLELNSGGKRYEFIGVDSSFILSFEKRKKGIHILQKEFDHGPFDLRELLSAIDRGIEIFLSDPRNNLSFDSAMHDDFDCSRTSLKTALVYLNSG